LSCRRRRTNFMMISFSRSHHLSWCFPRQCLPSNAGWWSSSLIIHHSPTRLHSWTKYYNCEEALVL
jgi:hypothetical protein